jgi:hypothetical protein
VGKKRAVSQARKLRRRNPKTITVVFTTKSGRRFAIVKFQAALFAKVTSVLDSQGVTFERFFNEAVKEFCARRERGLL